MSDQLDNPDLSDIRGTTASAHLDLIRGVAAIAVLAYHVRYRFFVDFADISQPSAVDWMFYTATSFGHDAVMVFFVLSGFLISSSVIRDHKYQRWSWKRYAENRLVRLYVVLIPAIFLTFGCDFIGLNLYRENPIYSGAATQWQHDYFDVNQRLNIETAFGNAMFLQTILVPPFGSNDPLWSLAFEFWYYALFPCLYLGIFGNQRLLARVTCFAIAIAVALIVTPTILLYFPIWLMGTLIGRAKRLSALSNQRVFRISSILALGIFLSLMVSGHIQPLKAALGSSVVIMDYLTAFGFAIFLYVILHDNRASTIGFQHLASERLAGISYTLYATHMPMLMLIRAALIPGKPWKLQPFTFLLAFVISVVLLLLATAIAHATELRTNELKRVLRCRFRQAWSVIAEGVK